VQLELKTGKRLSMDDDTIAVQDEKGNALTIQSSTGTLTIRVTGRVLLQASQISLESAGTILSPRGTDRRSSDRTGRSKRDCDRRRDRDDRVNVGHD